MHADAAHSYGLLGLEAMDAVLRDHFVATELISNRSTAPLGVDAYLRRVLVPETAVCLIMADRRCDRPEAYRVLKASRAYGLAAFS
jgi:hypothetical protein